jgi:amino acid permease
MFFPICIYIYIHTYINKQTNKYLVLSDVNFKTRRTTRPQQLSASQVEKHNEKDKMERTGKTVAGKTTDHHL